MSEDKKVSTARLAEDAEQARHELTGNVLPFWLKHGMDPTHGGIMTGLDRRGELVETDKAMWFQGRFAWILARTWIDVEQKREYLDAALSCVRFINEHGFDSRGRMWYRVTREGEPVRMRRYLFTECFAVSAYAAVYEATGVARYLDDAVTLLERILYYRDTPGLLEPKDVSDTRPARGFALPMILMNVAQSVRAAIEAGTAGGASGRNSSAPVDTTAGPGKASGVGTVGGLGETAGADDPASRGAALSEKIIEESIDEIARYFVNEEHRCVLEMCGEDGELLDHFEGRLLNPGHAIEGAWFILEEAAHRMSRGVQSENLVALGTKMLEWMWDWGWDREHGGIFYFRDARGFSSPEYWHDMKFWWPHTEAINACLAAWKLTGDQGWLALYEQVKSWTYDHFPDDEYGEWFGYLHRDGSVSSDLKGTMFKGPFHIPRMLLTRTRLGNGA